MNSQIPLDTDTSNAIPRETRAPQPYPASFIDRFMDFVERLPVPYWLTYLALFALHCVMNHVLSWVDGWLPTYTLSPLLFLYPVWLWGPLAIITYLDSLSLWALSVIAPLLDIPEEAMRRLRCEFTTMPARSVLISGLFWAIVYLAFMYIAFDAISATYAFGTLASVYMAIQGLVTFFIGSAIYYHSVRQLLLVNRTVKLVKQFNLFRLDPVYAFSVVTSRTGVAWVFLISVTLLTIPVQLATFPILALLTVQIVMVIAVFALPLRIVNLRLVTEKRRLLAELNQRVEAMLAHLHRCLDANELGEMQELNNALTSLNAERDILTGIPTWPWRAGLLTGFLSIVVLPVILFLVQLVLGRWLDW